MLLDRCWLTAKCLGWHYFEECSKLGLLNAMLVWGEDTKMLLISAWSLNSEDVCFKQRHFATIYIYEYHAFVVTSRNIATTKLLLRTRKTTVIFFYFPESSVTGLPWILFFYMEFTCQVMAPLARLRRWRHALNLLSRYGTRSKTCTFIEQYVCNENMEWSRINTESHNYQSGKIGFGDVITSYVLIFCRIINPSQAHFLMCSLRFEAALCGDCKLRPQVARKLSFMFVQQLAIKEFFFASLSSWASSCSWDSLLMFGHISTCWGLASRAIEGVAVAALQQEVGSSCEGVLR